VAVITYVRTLRILACATLAVGFLAAASSAAIAQPTADGIDRAVPSVEGSASNRMFGVLPNYATVEGPTEVPPISASQKFKLASLNTFDPYVYPFVGVVAAMNRDSGAHGVGYAKQYAVSFTDNSVGNLLTSAVLPSVLHQDPRYFQRGSGGFLGRLAYAASRSVVTRGDAGHAQFNVSEIGGNAIAAGLSNLYYPATERTVTGTLSRWGMQVMWDTLSNELKEFWPDVRRKLHRE
jgi:opacity protein-like surface antigen